MSLLLRRRLMMSLGADPYPDDGRWCYACSNKNLWVSTNFGVNWTDLGQLTSNTSSFRQVRISGTPSGVCAALADACIWNVGPESMLVSTSLSAGANYKSLCASSGSPFPAYTHLAYQGSSTQVIMYKRQSSGSVEQRQQFNTNDQVPFSGSSCSDDGQYALFGGAAGFSNCFRTANFGTNWAETLATSSYSGGDAQTCMSKTGQYQFVVLASVFCFSSDYGANWAVMNKPFAATCCAMNADGSKIYVAGAGGVRVASKDNWQTWTQVNNTLTNIQSISCNMSGKKLIACQNNQLWYSHNSGESWTMAKEGLFTAVSMCRGNVELGGGISTTIFEVINSVHWGGPDSYAPSPMSSLGDGYQYMYVYGSEEDGADYQMTLRNVTSTAQTIYIANSSEVPYDYTYVSGYGDASQQNETWVPIVIPAQTTVTVGYRKDGSVSSGEDMGFLAFPGARRVVHEYLPAHIEYTNVPYKWSSDYRYNYHANVALSGVKAWTDADDTTITMRVNTAMSSVTFYLYAIGEYDSCDSYDYWAFRINGSLDWNNATSVCQYPDDDWEEYYTTLTINNLAVGDVIEAEFDRYRDSDEACLYLPSYICEPRVIS